MKSKSKRVQSKCVFITLDGKQWDEEERALRHDAELEFRDFLNANMGRDDVLNDRIIRNARDLRDGLNIYLEALERLGVDNSEIDT